jgi:hypothetical protein
MIASLNAASAAQGFLIASKKWSVPIYYANSATPKTTFSLTASWAAARTMSGVPIPAGAAPDPSGDGHMAIIDRGTGCEYDFFRASRRSDGSWTAAWGNTLPITGSGIFPFGTSARGSGFGLGAGLITPADIAAGSINHALVFSYPSTKAGGPISPATESDGTTTSSGAIPMGARLQLDPTLDLNSLGLTPWQRMVARALQQYGMILGDTGGGVSLYAQNPQSMVTGYPWGNEAYAYLPSSLTSKMRVLAMTPQFSQINDLVPTGCATMR